MGPPFRDPAWGRVCMLTEVIITVISGRLSDEQRHKGFGQVQTSRKQKPYVICVCIVSGVGP